MNILIDNFNNNDKYRDINTDFRNAIMFELLMQDNSIKSKKSKILNALKIFYNDLSKITSFDDAINTILDFYTIEKQEKTSKKSKENTDKKIIFSYEYDAEYIYSAFLEQYNINLQQIEYLHWWEFKALFNSLSEKTKFMKIVEYRTVNLAKIKDKDKKKFYKEMKKIYALPDMRSEEEKESDFADALW